MSERDKSIQVQPMYLDAYERRKAKRRRRRGVLLAGGAVAVVAIGVYGIGRLLDDGPGAEEYLASARAYAESGDRRAAVIALRNALQREPDDREARWALAQHLLALGDAGGGLKELERAKALGQSGEEVARLELRAMLLQGRHAEVLGRLATEPAVDGSVALLRLRAAAQLGLGKTDGAQQSYEAVLAIAPGDPEALKGLARLAMAQQPALAGERLDAVLAADERDAEAWLLRGELSLSQARNADALAAFEQAAALRTDDLTAPVGIARAELALGRVDDARKRLAGLSVRHPKVPALAYWRGFAAQRAGAVDDAIAAYREVLSLVPDHPPSLLGLAGLLRQTGDRAQAAELAGRLVRSRPESVPARRLLGQIQLETDEPAAAVETLARAAQLAPEDAETLALLGNAQLRSGDARAGLESLRRAERLAPESVPIKTWLAMAQMALGAREEATATLEDAVALDSTGSEPATLLVLSLLREGRRDEALKVARDAAAERPDDPARHNLLGGALVVAGEVAAARGAFDAALALQPGFAPALVNLARLDAGAGDHDGARARYRQVIERLPGNVQALLGLAGYALQRGARKEAIALLERARAADARALAPRLVLAEQYLVGRDAEMALQVAREAHARSPEDPRAGLILGRAQYGSGKVDDAVRTLDALAQRSPTPVVYYHLGIARSPGDAAGAGEAFNAALELDPAYIPAKLALGALALRDGDTERALTLAAELRAAHPARAEGFALTGDAHAAAGRHEDALAAYREAHRVAPGGRFVVAMSNMERALGRGDEAAERLAEWLAAHPGDQLVRQSAAQVAQVSGADADAISGYEAVLARDPNAVAALNNLAWLYLVPDPDRALSLAERAYALAPEHPAVLDTYGWVLVKAGKAEQGTSVLRRAVERSPGDAEHQYHLAVGLAEIGDIPGARELLVAATTSAEPFRGKSAAESLLKRLSRSANAQQPQKPSAE